MQSIFSFFILLKCTKLHSHSKFLHKKRNRRIIMQIVQRGWSHDRASLRGFVCTKFFSFFRLHQRKLSSLIMNINLSCLVVVLYLSEDHLISFWCSTEWLKFFTSANVSTDDSTAWQWGLLGCIVIGWKVCRRMKIPLFCHVPVRQNSGRKPNGLKFSHLVTFNCLAEVIINIWQSLFGRGSSW